MLQGDAELENFIQRQKEKLSQEKEFFLTSKEYKHNHKLARGENVRVALEEGNMSQVAEVAGGLQLGGYAERQRLLRQERAKEYQRFLAEKEFRSQGKMSPLLGGQQQSSNNPSEVGERLFQQREVDLPSRKDLTTPDLYEELLRRKRAEEKKYRDNYEDPEVAHHRPTVDGERENRGNKREVSFNLDDEGLFEWARLKAKGQRGHSATADNRKEIPSKENGDGSSRSKSVPPEPSGLIFGGSTKDSVKLQKQAEYKRQLEEQIREKEEMKRREKMKWMGTVSSSTDHQKTEDDSRSGKKGELEEDFLYARESKKSSQRGKWERRREEDLADGYQDSYGRPGYPGFDPYIAMMYGPYGAPRHPAVDRFRDPYLNYPPMQRGYPAYEGDRYGPSHDYRRGSPSSERYYKGPSENGFEGRERERRRQSPEHASKGDDSLYARSTITRKDKAPPGGYTSPGIFGQDSAGTDKDDARARQRAYQEELKRQIEEKEKQKQKEKAERERYEAKIEAQIQEYNPWGKGGGGAPIKDDRGQIVTNLRTLRQHNQDGKIISPREQPGARDSAVNADIDIEHSSPMMAALEQMDGNNMSPRTVPLDGSMNKSSPYARGAALKELQGRTQGVAEKNNQDEYREYLRLQVEEKNRRKKEEQDKIRAEEEKENRRLEEQRKRIEREFLEEQENQRKKEEEVRQKNDELRKAAEQKRLETERKQKETEEERQQYTLKRSLQRKSLEDALHNARASSPLTSFAQKQHYARTSSPPIPTIQKQHYARTSSPPIPTIQKQVFEARGSSPPIPTVAKQQRTEDRGSPPVPAVIKQQKAESRLSRPTSSARKEEESVTVNPAAMVPARDEGTVNVSNQQRREFSSKAQDVTRIQERKEESDMTYLNSIRDNLYNYSPGSNDVVEQHHVLTQLKLLRTQLLSEEKKLEADIETTKDKYRELKSKGVARRPSANSKDIFEKARIKHSWHRKQDNRAVEEFRRVTEKSSILDFKSDKELSSDLDARQREFLRQQEDKLIALRDLLDKSAKNLHLENQRMNQIRASKVSLLDSDSKFVEVGYDGDTEYPNQGQSASGETLSEKVRHGRDNKEANSSPRHSITRKPQSPGGISTESATTLAIEEIAARNEERLRQLKLQEDREHQQSDPHVERADAVLNDFLSQKP